MASIRRRGQLVTVSLTDAEGSVLADLAEQVVELLGGEDRPSDGDVGGPVDPLDALVGMPAAGDVPVPDDPAVHRLLPDAYDAGDEAAEFRRLTDGDLRAAKTAALRRLADEARAAATGVIVELDEEGAHLWLQGLNDVRLVLGERLGVREDVDLSELLDPDDPRAPLAVAYDWLSGMQETLLRRVARW